MCTTFLPKRHPSSALDILQVNDMLAHMGQGITEESDLGLIEIIHIGGDGETQLDKFLSILAAAGT